MKSLKRETFFTWASMSGLAGGERIDLSVLRRKGLRPFFYEMMMVVSDDETDEGKGGEAYLRLRRLYSTKHHDNYTSNERRRVMSVV